MPFSKIGSMGCNFISDNANTDIFTIGQTEMFFGRNVAKHCRTEPSDLRSTDS